LFHFWAVTLPEVIAQYLLLFTSFTHSDDDLSGYWRRP
jgi:hypothetical protein